VTLFIADTNDRVRQRLASIAASVEGIKVVGDAGEVGEAIGGINRTKPDSVFAAIHMSGGSGFDILSAAKSAASSPVVTMLAPGPCSECRVKCSAMGADFFFEKSGQIKQIVTTLVLLAHYGAPPEPGATSVTFQDQLRYDSSLTEPETHASANTPTICPLVSGAPRTNCSSPVPANPSVRVKARFSSSRGNS
jgi:DNA-binding NarL/FixJ family response regulator